MTHEASIDGEITTNDEFEAVLGQLLAAANANGVEPEGGWEYRSNGADPDWEVVIVELEKRVGSD